MRLLCIAICAIVFCVAFDRAVEALERIADTLEPAAQRIMWLEERVRKLERTHDPRLGIERALGGDR